MVDTLAPLPLKGAWKFLKSQCDARLAFLRDIVFEELLTHSQPYEELHFGRVWNGGITIHVNLLDQQTVRVVVHGVLEFRRLGNYHNYIDGFRRKRDGSFERLTKEDYNEFD